MLKKQSIVIFLLVLLGAGSTSAQNSKGELMLWVQREHVRRDNALESELSINGKLINLYSSDNFEPIGKHVREGWNSITIVTKPQEPATYRNRLIFRIGRARRDNDARQLNMNPVLWEFTNGTDWEWQKNGTYLHRLGPGVKEIRHTFKVFYAGAQGFEDEDRPLGEGDFILTGRSQAGSTAVPPITGTVFVNGHPINTVVSAPRQIVITPFLKKGKNEIKLVSSRVGPVVRDNDVIFSIAGPAEWSVKQKQYVVKPVMEFRSKQGWLPNTKTYVLENGLKKDSDQIERTLSFVVKDSEAPVSN